IIDTARELAEKDGWAAVTTRRLADAIEYSQPVLCSHFAGKNEIMAAVAVQGFAELAELLAAARRRADDELAAVAKAYLDFARRNPAVYDAMFTLADDLAFATPRAPQPLRDGFAQIRDTVAPLAGERDPGVLAELTWAALHGIVTLTRDKRLPARLQQQRIRMLVGLLRPS